MGGGGEGPGDEVGDLSMYGPNKSPRDFARKMSMADSLSSVKKMKINE